MQHSKTYIFHVDANSAFLSWSAVYQTCVLGKQPDLRSIPSIVGGDQEKRHGIVLAKSIPAKKYGIQTGEAIVTALQKCPSLAVVPPDYSLYVTASKAFMPAVCLVRSGMGTLLSARSECIRERLQQMPGGSTIYLTGNVLTVLPFLIGLWII